MLKITKKQRIAQEEAYAKEMQELEIIDNMAAEKEILKEIEAEAKAERTRGGMFEDAYGGPLVISIK